MKLLFKLGHFKALLLLVLMLICALGTLPVHADEPTVASSPNATDKIAPTAIAVDQIGEQIGTYSLHVRKINDTLHDNENEVVVSEQVEVLNNKLSEFTLENEKLYLENTPTDVWRARATILNGYKKDVDALAEKLHERTGILNALGDDLAYRQKVWDLTKTSVKSAKLNASVLSDIDNVLESLTKYEQQVRQNQSDLVNLQNGVFALHDQIAQLLKDQENVIAQGRDKLMERNSASLWHQLTPSLLANAWKDWIVSLGKQLNDLVVYLDKNGIRFVIYLLVFGVTWLLIRAIHRVISPLANQNGELSLAMHLIEAPASIAALIAVALFMQGDGTALGIVKVVAGLSAIVPALMVMRRVLADYWTPLLNAVLLVYVIELVNKISYEVTLVSRLSILAEAVCIVLFLSYYLRRASFAKAPEERRESLIKWTRIVGGIALVGAIFAICANLVGYLGLAALIVQTILMTSVSANILLAAAHLVLALVLFLITVKPLSLVNLVNLNRAHILRVSRVLLYWLAFFMTVNSACVFAGYGWLLSNLISSLFGLHIAYGNINVTVGQCLIAILVLYLSRQLSKLFVSLTQHDIVPRLELQPNASNVVLFFAQYVPYIVCILIASAILGLDIENLALVVSALSLGIGFGLQNIIQNFISGLILLFEPRIAVGGVVEFGNFSGVLVNVGMRASMVRLFDGRNVIVPNSELISNKVISITNTKDVPYRFSIPFVLLEPIDVDKVKEVAEKCARENEYISEDPGPSLAVSGIENGYPRFNLLAWAKNYDVQVKAQNTLTYSLLKAIKDEGWQLAGTKNELIQPSDSDSE